MTRKLSIFVFTNAAAIIVGLVLFEAYLVLNKHAVLSPLPEGIRYEDRGNPTVWQKANFSGTALLTGVHYKTNQFGFRGNPISPKKNIFLALGDSTTYGLNLDFEDAYPSILEKMASKMLPRDGIQIVNTAFPGQGTVMQYFMLRCVASIVGKERIKGVSLGFFHNDFSNNVAHVSEFRKIKDFDCRDQKHPYGYWPQRQHGNKINESRLSRFLRNLPKIGNSLTYNLVAAHYEDWVGKSTARLPLLGSQASSMPVFGEFKSDDYVYKPRQGREVEWDLIDPNALPRNEAFRITIEMLINISEWAASRRIPFIFVYLPGGDKEIAELHKSPEYKEAIFKEICNRPFVSCIDMLQEYRTYLKGIGHSGLPLPKGFYSRPNDAAHPGPGASQMIADALVRSIQSRSYAQKPYVPQ